MKKYRKRGVDTGEGKQKPGLGSMLPETKIVSPN